MVKNRCGICNRISNKEVFDAVNKICKESKINNMNRRLLYIKTLEILKLEDEEKCLSLWCGRKINVIIGSIAYVVSRLFYIKQEPNEELGYINTVLSQRCIANALNITEVSIRNLYKKIVKKHFVELSEAF